MDMKKEFKDYLKTLGQLLLGFVFIILILYFWGEISSQYKYNHKYSIAMPEIIGKFDVTQNYISVWGLNNIVGDEVATLTYSEVSCVPAINYCSEDRVTITGLGNTNMIIPKHEEYKIKYLDNGKLIFGDDLDVIGEIDFNHNTLFFTIKNAGFERNETRKIEIITNNKEIEKLEKKIISKYLKKKWFK